MFRDRTEAGHLLAQKLAAYKNSGAVVLAVPRGGIPIAAEVSAELRLPLDLALTKKIGHPLNKEYAIGAVSMTESFIIPHEEVSGHYIERETAAIRARLKEIYKKMMGGRAPLDIRDKTVIVIDDGVATGNTLLATIRMLRKEHPAKIIIAVPVASENAIEKLEKEADEVICLLIPAIFMGVGAFFEDFVQVSDEEALAYLRKTGNHPVSLAPDI